VSPETAKLFGIGLSDRSGRAVERLLAERGFRPEHMEAAGLVGRREDGSLYDRFRNRLMFPIHNETGKIIAFGGRALDPGEKAKYLNSPETKIYKKSNVLFNLNRARKTAMEIDRLVLVEGYMDVIGATQAGITEAVASCGTALTAEQVRAMRRYSANLHLNFDPDAAGASAAERSIRLLLDENVRVRIVELEEGLDPDEYCRKFGAEVYRQRVTSARTYFYWLADRARAKYNTRDPQGRVDAFQALIPAIQGLHDKLERMTVTNDLASYLGIEAGLVLDRLRKAATENKAPVPAPGNEFARATDRLLLPLLLGRAEDSLPILEELRTLSAWRAFPTARIYETIIATFEQREPISFDSVNGRLTESDQAQLAALLLDCGRDGSVEDGLACLAALKREEKEARRRDLRNRIKSAEREGRIAEALRLIEELGSFDRQG
jgi:DNA primase